MKAVKVVYTVKAEYAEKNAENINGVMNELRRIDHPGLKYSAFRMEDKKSFVHFVLVNDEEAEKMLTNLDSFKKFQAELKASRPEVPPGVEPLLLVGCSYDLF
jgi:hypothetical protein